MKEWVEELDEFLITKNLLIKNSRVVRARSLRLEKPTRLSNSTTLHGQRLASSYFIRYETRIDRPLSIMPVDRRKAFVFGAALALRLALLVLFPSLPDLLTGRVEVSTPVNSFKRREFSWVWLLDVGQAGLVS